jgi:hypothetical protein
MYADNEFNPRKNAIYQRIAIGLLLVGALHGLIQLLIDGTQLDAEKLIFFLVLPLSVVLTWVSIRIVTKQSGLVAVTPRLSGGNWYVASMLMWLGPICVYATAATYNMVLDYRETAQHTVAEMGQYLSKGRGSSYTYFVTVRDEDDPQKREADIRVSEAFYASLHPGEKLRVMYHKGAFGFPWLSGLTLSDPSLPK